MKWQCYQKSNSNKVGKERKLFIHWLQAFGLGLKFRLEWNNSS